MKVRDVLCSAVTELKRYGVEEPVSKARRVLAYVLGRSKEYLISHDGEEISSCDVEKFKCCIRKLINGVPIQYVIGFQEFMGIEFEVNENVLIPQPDTEILVYEVLNIARKYSKPKILDLCTGSGAIAISLSRSIPSAQIWASDISEEAIKIAKRNDKYNKVTFVHSDLFENISTKFDIIVSNPPYIKSDEIKTLSKEVQNEPKIALDGGKSGLDFYEKIINNANKYLTSQGHLCLEIGEDQKDAVLKIFKTSNIWTEIETYKDLGNNDRVITAKINIHN